MHSNSHFLPRFLSFGKRLLRHYLFGTQPVAIGKNWEQRCKRYIMALNRPDYGMRGRIALEELRRDIDLLCEEAALFAGPLQLQLLVLKLAATEPGARQFMSDMFEESPVVKLFFAILSQAEKDGASQIRINFSSDPHPIRVHYLTNEGWSEAMTVPRSLIEPLQGIARRLEASGVAPVLPYIESQWRTSGEFLFDWPDGALVITLVRPASGTRNRPQPCEDPHP